MIAADVIWFIDPSWSVAQTELGAAAQLLQSDQRIAAVLILGPDDALTARLWRELPPPVAALARPWPLERPMCVRQTLWESAAHHREAPDPQWQFLIRAGLAGHTIETVTAAPAGSSVTVRKRGQTPSRCISGVSTARAAGGLTPFSDSFSAGSPDENLPALAPRPPGRARNWLREQIAAATPESLLGRIDSPPDAIALKAGLLLLGDWLDDSHSHSQSIEGEGRHRAGDYWHGILHRREPDDSNAKYWFRRVGRHPVFEELAPEADRILAGCASPEAGRWRQRLITPSGWDAFAFVDLCSHCRRIGDAGLETVARRIQLVEMLLLLIHTCRDAAGRATAQPSGRP